MKTLTVQAFTLPLMWVVILFLADGIHSQEMTPPAVRVLIVTGGHDFERIPFFEMFRGFEGIEFQEAVHPSADSLLNPGLRRSFDAVVFYDMPAETAERFKTDFVNLLNEGIGVVFLHHSIASYQTGWDGFEEILGGKYHEKAGEKDGKERDGGIGQTNADGVNLDVDKIALLDERCPFWHHRPMQLLHS